MAGRDFLKLALAALPIAAAAPASDGAGNRVAPFPSVERALSADGEQSPFALHCTADRRWCARLRRNEAQDEWRLEVAESGAAPRSYVPAGQEGRDVDFAIRTELVREADGAALIGVERTRTTGFAGGGARATQLELVRAAPGAAALAGVLDEPVSAIKDIRACFGERDRRARHGACSDQYEFSAALTLDPATRAGRPRFRFVARARTYPGRRMLEADSTTAPPLRRSDLAWATDPACSYARRFAYDEAAGIYVANEALPECADYLDF
jgi:hypothetical protein